MNPTLTRLLGAAAAVATGTTALLGAGAGTAGAGTADAHCDRAERPVWSEGPSRNVTGHGCSVPAGRGRWYTVEIGTLVQPHYRTDHLNGGVDRIGTRHDTTLRCLGHTSGDGAVNWFGCLPH